jgi:hypothetical protein
MMATSGWVERVRKSIEKRRPLQSMTPQEGKEMGAYKQMTNR